MVSKENPDAGEIVRIPRVGSKLRRIEKELKEGIKKLGSYIETLTSRLLSSREKSE
jgi:hypothetical protein